MNLKPIFFLDLVQLARAGIPDLKGMIKRRLKIARDKVQALSERLSYDVVLNDNAQALFYSSWIFSAIRLLTSIPNFQDGDAISEFLGIPKVQVNRALEFLLASNLCREEKGKIVMGEARTYVGKDSPLVARHHTNWRMRALRQVEVVTHEELMFTNVVTLSKRDFKKIREEIIQLIEKFRMRIDASPPEELACLNIDWIYIRKPT